jgi:hypothetical protein
MKWYPRAILAGFALGFFISLLSGRGATTLTGRLGADYPAFYGAGKIIAEGDGQSLYQSKRLALAEQGLFPSEENAFMPFPYPVFVAFVYSPLALLSYRVSYIIHTLLMVGALLFGLQLLRPMSRASAEHFFFVFALLVSYYPLLRSIIGGQNTVISFLLVSLLWRAVKDDHDFRAGIFLGLLLFKPQYGLPFMGLFLLSGRWKVTMIGAMTGLAEWAVGVWLSGWAWIGEWLKYANWVSSVAATIDKHNAVSWIGFFGGISSAGSTLGTVAGYLLACVTVAITCKAWWRSAWSDDFTAQMALAVSCIILVPPHVCYYDAGLLVFAWIAFFPQDWRYKNEVIAGMWILGFTQGLAEWLGFSPIFFVAVFTFIMALQLGRKWLLLRCSC